MNNEVGSIVDDIVQDALPVHTGPTLNDFKPWHKVRKEFIRRHQWNELTARMIKGCWRRQLNLPEIEWAFGIQEDEDPDVEMPKGTVLRQPLQCLMIPGDDLLDIRALWRDIQPHNCSIRYLGFNESHGSDQHGTHIHVSNNAVTSLPNVCKDSRVIQDRFETIRHSTSQAYRYLNYYGPYHIVNLDLCESFFPNTEKTPQEYYDALVSLLAYQFEYQKTEWLLFITTIVKPAVVHAEMFQKLCTPTRSNVDDHATFANKIGSYLPPETFTQKISVDISILSSEQVIKLFGVALGKYLLALCHHAQPQWTIAMRRSYSYNISEAHNATMLSLAFELKPNVTPPMDTTGISSLAPRVKTYPDECTCAIKIAESVAHIRDVDAEIGANPELKNALREASAALLQDAGYNRDDYLKWVEQGETLQIA